jgi:hypothetical protein
LDVATERMFAEPSIMETIASISKALHEYERAGGFAPPATSEAAKVVTKGHVAGTELAVDAPTPPPTGERREAPLPQPTEAAKTTAVVAATGTGEVVVGVAGSSSSRPVSAGDDEVCVPNEPTVAVQEKIAPEDTTRAASPEIHEVEEVGAAVLMGAVGGEVQSLELACTSWVATSGSGVDAEDDEEAAACNTLERGLN